MRGDLKFDEKSEWVRYFWDAPLNLPSPIANRFDRRSVRRQAFYQHNSRQMTGEERDQQVLSLVEQTRADHPRIGGKKLYDLIKDELMTKGIKMGRVFVIETTKASNYI